MDQHVSCSFIPQTPRSFPFARCTAWSYCVPCSINHQYEGPSCRPFAPSRGGLTLSYREPSDRLWSLHRNSMLWFIMGTIHRVSQLAVIDLKYRLSLVVARVKFFATVNVIHHFPLSSALAVLHYFSYKYGKLSFCTFTDTLYSLYVSPKVLRTLLIFSYVSMLSSYAR